MTLEKKRIVLFRVFVILPCLPVFTTAAKNRPRLELEATEKEFVKPYLM
jgi:hypothetical protein